MEEEFKFVEMESVPFEELILKAEEAYSEMQYPKANAFYEQAYKEQPQNEDLLCSYANFLTEIGEMEKARALLKEALLIDSETSQNYKKFMQMAELVQGTISAGLYEKGIEILIKLYNPIVPDDKLQNEYKRDLAMGYSALAEIYQTDLIHEEKSETKCRENIEKAIYIDNKCLDAYLQYANYYLNNEDKESAIKYLDFILNELQNLDSKKNLEEEKIEEVKENELLNENESDLYDITFKLSVAKIFIEINEHKKALILLESYYEEDNSNPEVVYLLSFCNFQIKNYNQSFDYNEELKKLKFDEDEELFSAAQELDEELQKVDFNMALDGKEEGNEEIIGDDSDWMEVE